MNLLIWIKKQPLWLKGGIIGVGVYLLCVFLSSFIFMVGSPLADKYHESAIYQLFSPFLSVLIPLLIVSFYPGLIFAGDYENITIIIPFNLIFYFVLGTIIGFLISNSRKRTIQLEK